MSRQVSFLSNPQPTASEQIIVKLFEIRTHEVDGRWEERNMKKELTVAWVIGGIFLVVIGEAKGTIDEGSNRCGDVTQNCTVGNGVGDCPAIEWSL